MIIDPTRPPLCQRCHRRPTRFVVTVQVADQDTPVRTYHLCQQCEADLDDTLESLVSRTTEAQIQGD